MRWPCLLIASMIPLACGGREESDRRAADVVTTADESDSLLYCPKIPQFEAFAVDTVFRGIPAPVDFSSDPDAREYRTVLSRGAKLGPNFAGHLTVVERGCGSPCQVQTLIDARTGRLVGAVSTSLGAIYRLSSRLLIANPSDSSGCYDVGCAYCRPTYYLWSGNRLDRIRSGP